MSKNESVPQNWNLLGDWLLSYFPDLKELLCEGAGTAEIAELEQRIGSDLPDEMRQFYRCYNGQTESSPALFDGFEFMNLSQMGAEYERLKDLSRDEELSEGMISAHENVQAVYWAPGWIPFAYHPTGSFLFIDLNPTSSGKQGQVIVNWLGSEGPSLEDDSLAKWFHHFVERVLKGEMHYDEDEYAFVEIEED